jgi:hypothetical protein
MKTKSLVLFLALALVSWGQTVNPSAPTDKPGQPAATQCACCNKMAAGASSDHKACCHSNKSKGGETAACCSKEGKSCCSDKAQCGKPDTANATTASCRSAKGQCGAKVSPAVANTCNQQPWRAAEINAARMPPR